MKQRVKNTTKREREREGNSIRITGETRFSAFVHVECKRGISKIFFVFENLHAGTWKRSEAIAFVQRLRLSYHPVSRDFVHIVVTHRPINLSATFANTRATLIIYSCIHRSEWFAAAGRGEVNGSLCCPKVKQKK